MNERLKIALVDFALFIPIEVALWAAYKAAIYAALIIEKNSHQFWG